jgi:hypothetical protein
MKKQESRDEWAKRIRAKYPDVIITEDTVEVPHREGESREEYLERFHECAPPFTPEQEELIRAASDEYWETMREQARRERRQRRESGQEH